MTGAGILHVDGLRFAYAGQPPIANDWSATIGAGVTLLHGDTGSGKSTLLRCIAGTLPLAAGALTVSGTRLDKDGAAYRQRLFFCDPTTERFDQVTARACTRTLREGDANFDEGEWQALADGFSLAPHLDKPMYMLSTGSRRKVWLAVALASGRALTLLDEPTGALDAGSIRCLWAALARIAAEGERAVVLASYERIQQLPLAATIELPLSPTAPTAPTAQVPP